MSALAILVVTLVFATNMAAASEVPGLWIDADPTCDRPGWNDVDDCLAIAHLLARRGPDVRGISSVFGNSPQAATVERLGKMLAQIGAPIELIDGLVLAEGASTARSDTATAASHALVMALERERLGIVALGPLTNVATVLRLRPDLRSRIAFVVFVGGGSPGMSFKLPQQQLLHFHDQNVQMDIAAVGQVLASGVSLRLLPFQAAIGMHTSTPELAMALPLAPELLAAAERWQLLWHERLGITGFVPFDLVAAAYVTNPAAFVCRAVTATVVDPRRALTRRRRHLVLIGVSSFSVQ